MDDLSLSEIDFFESVTANISTTEVLEILILIGVDRF